MSFQPPPAGGFGGGPAPGPFGPMGPGPAPMPSSDRLAVTGLILGVLSLPAALCCFLGVPLGVAGVLVSRHARQKIEREPHLHHGERLTKIGFWCGLGGIAMTVLSILLSVIPAFLRGTL